MSKSLLAPSQHLSVSNMLMMLQAEGKPCQPEGWAVYERRSNWSG